MGAGVRAFVAVFLAAFVACGLFQVEVWPFSGWQLFSHVRTGEIRGWLATGVEPGGVERPIPFGSFAAGHRGELQVLKGFDDLSPGARRDVCRAWAGETARIGATRPVEIRIYATVEPTRAPEHDRLDEKGGQRRLRHVCPAP